MSDSVTNVQIEDVLSSIRKLVSEEVRAQTRDGRKISTSQNNSQAKAVDSESEPAEDRLLLTPALRVQPGATTESVDEAPFTHAEETREEADLLDLMARVREAGAKQASIEAKRPAGIAPVARPKQPDFIMPATEDAVRSALFALGDNVRASIWSNDLKASQAAQPEKVQRKPFPPRPDEAPEESLAEDDNPATTTSLSGDAALRLDARDTLAFAGRDDKVHGSGDDEVSDVVPKFLHRRGITSLGQRIAEVESVVTTSGGDWEPEADEDAEAAPGPQASSVPWDEPEADRDFVATAVVPDVHQDEDDDFAEDASDDWAVDDAPMTLQFRDRPLTDVADADDDVVATDFAGDEPEDDTSLAVGALDDVVEMAEAALATVEDEEAVGDMSSDMLATLTAEEDKVPLDEEELESFAAAAPFEAVTAPEVDEAEDDMAADYDEMDEADDADTYVARSESRVDADYYEDDRQTLAADEALIDEEMLRDLVSEIVRQELQGALGERITRNVRKLVRREIHRALTAQDLR